MLDLRRHFVAAIFPVLCFCGGFYFFHYAVNGQYGLTRLAAKDAELVALEIRLAALNVERARLAHRADLLSSNSLDPDLLDERARALLGYAAPGDQIIPIDDFANAGE
ncbi:MAG: septum formation initiator family protein [Pseudomonadota bacterium]